MAGDDQTLKPENWLTDHGDTLFRYALVRTSNAHMAEDLVQETLLAAWRGRAGFRGLSSERTWLVGILKHKIDDHFRTEGHRVQADAGADLEEEAETTEDALFDERGHWRVLPEHWGDEPLAQLEADQFWQVFLRCLALLPESQRDSFILRDLEDLETEPLCKVLALSATNLYVLLHRARLQVRRCLEVHWFAPGNTP